jgi:atlastin
MNEGAAKEDLKGFAWRGGEHRQTTGIWMWSEPFVWRSSAHAEPFAILLMDTQGMFDNKTTMDVTVQIFGLSTLVSSYQVITIPPRPGMLLTRTNLYTYI